MLKVNLFTNKKEYSKNIVDLNRVDIFLNFLEQGSLCWL